MYIKPVKSVGDNAEVAVAAVAAVAGMAAMAAMAYSITNHFSKNLNKCPGENWIWKGLQYKSWDVLIP